MTKVGEEQEGYLIHERTEEATQLECKSTAQQNSVALLVAQRVFIISLLQH